MPGVFPDDVQADKPKAPKPRVHKSRVEIKLDHYAVRTRHDVTQYPQATGFDIDEDGNLTVVCDEDEVAGGRLAYIRSSDWDELYFPGAVRVMEEFMGDEYDAEGNVINRDG